MRHHHPLSPPSYPWLTTIVFSILFSLALADLPDVPSIAPETILDHYTPYMTEILLHVDQLERIINASSTTAEPPEGNAFYQHRTFNRSKTLVTKQANLLYYAQNVKTILEIGFNAGHSSLLFLFGSDKLIDEYRIFDLNEHPYVIPAVKYISKTFPSTRFVTTFGDSRYTVSEWLIHNPENIGKYDLVHVDGGHDESCYFTDITNAILLVKKGGLLIIDDIMIPFIRNHAMGLVRTNLFTPVDILDTMQTYPHLILRKN